MADGEFTINCPRCNATLTVPGQPKRDVVVQCSECGHKGKLPRKRRGSADAPIVLKAAKPAPAADDRSEKPPVEEPAASRMSTSQDVATSPSPLLVPAVLAAVAALGLAAFMLFKPADEDPSNETTASTDPASLSEEELSRRAFTVLKTHCSSCHANGETEGDFGDVLDHAKLIADKLRVSPGSADDSPLFERVRNAEMPPPDDVDTMPTSDEIAIVKAWIDRGAPSSGFSEAPAVAATDANDTPAVAANDTSDTPEVSDNEKAQLASAAHTVLKQHCYECHGQAGSVEGGFNFVLNRDKLIAGGRFVVPGKAEPDDRKLGILFRRIQSGSMPPTDHASRPTDEQIASVRKWIEAGAPEFETKVTREFIATDDVFKRIRDDLQTNVSEFDLKFTRYFTITHLYNAGLSEDELVTYRHALIKLLNSLSWERELYQPIAIDEEKTIFRIDLRKLEWTADTWQAILDRDPYAFSYTNDYTAKCAELTGERVPVVRADWFVFSASKPPLYHTILEIPATLDEMAGQLRVDIARNIHEHEVLRAGFNQSGVSANNRMIERHRSPYGAFWVSYDFAGNKGRQNLFRHPLGPGDSQTDFLHDGGEVIFNLPNGLQAYMLVDGKGKRIDRGPTDIVRDPKQVNGEVVNGVSCMSCHYAGIIAKSDEVGVAVRSNRDAFPDADRILQLYQESTELRKLQDEDAQRYQQSLAKLNVGQATEHGEPVLHMARRFESELDLAMAAAELGLTAEQLTAKIDSDTSLARAFGSLKIPNGTVKRDAFLEVFGGAAETLGFGRSLRKAVIASAAGATQKPDPTKPADLFASGTATFMSFDGKSVVRYRDNGGASRTIEIDQLSTADQEFVLKQEVADNDTPGDLPDDTPATGAPASASKPASLITTGAAELVRFDGRDQVTLKHRDGRVETVSIDTLSADDVEHVLKQALSSNDLPDDTPGAPADTAGQPQPASAADGENQYVWHGRDGKPLIEGLLHSFDHRAGVVRIAPAPRLWSPKLNEPFEGIFYIASMEPNGEIEIRIRRLTRRVERFQFVELSISDRQYLGLIRAGLESGRIVDVRSSIALRYWEVPIGELSKTDQQRVYDESGYRP